MINAYIFFQGKPGGKNPIGRPMRRWKNNFEIYLKQIVVVV
jgi:hypothetical protein